MSNSKLWLLVCGAALLAACGTKVPITEQAKLEDRTVVTQTSTAPTDSQPVNRDVKLAQVEQVAVSGPRVVYFDFDSFVIKPEYQATLETQAKFLVANRTTKIALGGHTDDIGGREYNLALGQKRADAVKRALAILGVSEAQMEAVSFGKEKPTVLGTDDAARAKNRRVEISAP